MSDTISIDNQPHFFKQAGTHAGVSDYINSTVIEHQPHVDVFTGSSTASTMPELGTSYARWWSSTGSKLGNYAQVHQIIGSHLKGLVDTFTAIDEHSATVVSR